jgi:hypothetical protein
VVRFEKDSYQGMPSGMPVQRKSETGFSRGRGANAQRLKPLVPKPMSASLKRCPDTNLFSNCSSNKVKD